MRKSKKSKVGLPPGSLVYTGPDRSEKVDIDLYSYTRESLDRKQNIGISTISEYKERSEFIWINVSGVHDVKLVQDIGNALGIHSLVLEDVVNVHIRPKLDEFGDYIYINCKMVYFIKENLHFENVDLILGSNFVVSFQEVPGDVFDPIRTRLNMAGSKLRNNGSDFLAYSLVDAVVDNYFIVLEELGEKLELIEDELEDNYEPDTITKIQHRKKNIIRFKKSVYPLREVVSKLQKSEHPLLKDQTVKYIRDLYDHVIQAIDTTESYREFVSSLADLYASKVSNRMNSIMQVLTIIGTIFIPLTFIAGIYGMNFDHMPELHYKYGYFIVWLLMIVITFVMIVFFRKRKWF